MVKEWIINDTAAQGSFIEKLLVARGFSDEKEIQDFLHPLETEMTHPNAFCDMPKAVDRIAKAIDNGENILIYGDFDADGVTSTSLLIRALTELDAKVDYFIPNRETEGHGLDSKALIKLMTQKKPKVIITVDCGVSNAEQVAFLNSFKIDVIITDHHEAPEILPKALAIIDPKAPNALDENLTAREICNLASLAGVGVAFKLALALLEHYDKLSFKYNILPYAAVGTISDVVPLVGENRYIVAKGLELISNGKHYGLKRLLEAAGYTLDNGITAEQIAFGIAPRINASGRLDTVTEAMKVMISDNKQEIEMAIIALNNFNKIRQDLCQNIFLEAEEMLKRENPHNNAIVLFNPNWHLGIVGIVASKLVEKYYKPTFLMTFSEETNQFRCSARGVDEINLYEIISANSELLDSFGGHAMAAGLAFSKEKTSFENVKKAINSTVNEIIKTKILTPTLKIDMEITPKELDINLINELNQMEPFGANNPTPIFAMKNLILKQKKLMGSNKNHLKMTLQRDDETFECIWWSKGDISLINNDRLDIAFCPQLNVFNGNVSMQLILQDVHADGLCEVVPQNDVKIYDHRKKTDILPQVNDYAKTSKFEIGIFAENKSVIDNLKPYNDLHKRIFNRQTLRNVDCIMFFDYPPTEESFNNIIRETQPKAIHFMRFENKKFDEPAFLKTLSGMVKYACNNTDGVFDLNRCACFLAESKTSIEAALNLFEDCGMIKIKSKNCESFKLDFVNNIELSKALHSSIYRDFLNEIEQNELYRESLIESDIIEI